MSSFGFQFNSVSELRNGLNASNGEQLNSLQQFWKYSMSLLVESMEKTALELCNSVENNKAQLVNSDDLKKKINLFSTAMDKITWTDSDINLDPSEFYKKFFNYSISAKQITGDQKKGWRSLFEHITALNQCKAAQKFSFTTLDWNTCYICGLPIYDSHNPSSVGVINESRECEHVLPAFTSLGYKGLLQSSDVSNLTDEEKKFFTYEYANAHRCCNQVKSDDKWINYDKKRGLYVVDLPSLQKTIMSIFESVQYDCKEIRNLIKKTYPNIDIKSYFESRYQVIIDNFLNPLLNIINRNKNDYGSLFELSIRIRQITALKKSIPQFAQAYLTGEVTVINKIKPPVLLLLTESKNLFKKQLMSTSELVFYDTFNKIFSPTLYSSDVMKNFLSFCYNGDSSRSLLLFAKKMYNYGFDVSKNSAPFPELNQQMLKNGLDIFDNLYAENDNEPIAKTVIQDNINILSINRTNQYLMLFYQMISGKLEEIKSTNDVQLNDINDLATKILSSGIFEFIQNDENEKMDEMKKDIIDDKADVENFKQGVIQIASQSYNVAQQGGKSKGKRNIYVMKGGDINTDLVVDNLDELKVSLLNDILKLGEELYTTTDIQIDPRSFIDTQNINNVENYEEQIASSRPQRITRPTVFFNPTNVSRNTTRGALYMVKIKNIDYVVTNYGLVSNTNPPQVLLFNYDEKGNNFVYMKNDQGIEVPVRLRGGRRTRNTKKNNKKTRKHVKK